MKPLLLFVLALAVGGLVLLAIVALFVALFMRDRLPEPLPESSEPREPGSGDDPSQETAPAQTTLTPELVARLTRTAFVPVCADEPDGDGSYSRFCGSPWLPQGEDWPACGLCHQPMGLFLQLDLDTLPEGAPPSRGGGLLQVFYCRNWDEECEGDCGWEPFGDMKLLRVLDPSQPGATAPRDVSTEPRPARHIVGWTPVDERPHYEDRRQQFPEVTDAMIAARWSDPQDGPTDGDKLGGWPSWVQAPEYPECPECGTTMEYLFQIDCDGNTGHDFGDAGCAHVTRCPDHPSVLGFGWACC